MVQLRIWVTEYLLCSFVVKNVVISKTFFLVSENDSCCPCLSKSPLTTEGRTSSVPVWTDRNEIDNELLSLFFLLLRFIIPSMKITNPFLRRTFGFLGTAFFRSLIGTVDFKWAFYDSQIDAYVAKRTYILMFWHEHILCPLFFRRHCPVTMLLSEHGDADLVSQSAGFLGMKCIRGSSTHGGANALKQFVQLPDYDILALVPDGPQGPYRHLAPGAIFLASKLQLPIVLLGVGYNHVWRMSTWDRFAIPHPFSRGRIISSPMISIPKRLTQFDREHYRTKLETLLTQLSDEAESWAVSGEPLAGESTVCMGPKSSLMYYGYSKKAVLPDG